MKTVNKINVLQNTLLKISTELFKNFKTDNLEFLRKRFLLKFNNIKESQLSRLSEIFTYSKLYSLYYTCIILSIYAYIYEYIPENKIPLCPYIHICFKNQFIHSPHMICYKR